jgi:mRNA interferase HigB
MRVINAALLFKAAKKHAGAARRLRAWLAEAEEAEWSCPQDIRDRFPSASFVSDDVVVFNIGGTEYRLVIRVDYRLGVLDILRFGTHAEYSKWKL